MKTKELSLEGLLPYKVKADIRELQIERGDTVYIDTAAVINGTIDEGDIIATYDPAGGLRLQRMTYATDRALIVGKVTWRHRHFE